MEFTQITATSPEKLIDALSVLERTVSIKTLCGMMWQPRGAVVIVGYEKHAPVERPAPKKQTRCNKDGIDEQGIADIRGIKRHS